MHTDHGVRVVSCVVLLHCAGSALAAAVIGCGLDIEVASALADKVFDECRDGGAAFRLK